MKKAFTLVEMVAVLALLALLTHVAMRQVSNLADSRKIAAADRQLGEIRAAVFDFPPGGEPSGFLADTGRLPKTKTGGAPGTLEELWEIPDGVSAYALRPAAAANLCVPEAEKAALADESVLVPCGWRGPYLRLAAGKTRLRDPWGNPLETDDGAGFARLDATNGFAVAVSHFGPVADLAAKKTVSLVPQGGASSRLAVNVVAQPGVSGTVKISWFGPSGSMITGACENVSIPGTALFEGLAPGVRILKDSVSGAARLVAVRPGDNIIQLSL